MSSLPSLEELTRTVAKDVFRSPTTRKSHSILRQETPRRIVEILQCHGFAFAAPIADHAALPQWYLLGFRHGLTPADHITVPEYRATVEAMCELMEQGLVGFVGSEGLAEGERYDLAKADHPLLQRYIRLLDEKGVAYGGRRDNQLVAEITQAHSTPEAPQWSAQGHASARIVRECIVPHIQEVQAEERFAGPKFYLMGAVLISATAHCLDALNIPYVAMVQVGR